MRSPAYLAWCAAALSGCFSAPPSSAPTPSITLALSNATVREAVVAFSGASHEPLVIDPAAEPVVDCARVSLETSGPRAPAEVAALLTAALAPHGFSLTHPSTTGWVLSHAGSTPIGCASAPLGGGAPSSASPSPSPVRVLADGESEVDIPRAELRVWLEDEDAMARAARIVPHTGEDGVSGLRLYGIRRSAMMGRLGFQNGDTVYSVNGYPVGSLEQALEAYARVRDADALRVELVRRGSRLVHTIRVTP